ncbi:MAG: ABC-F family ATP-binding cassette domain-containing protein [Flavobacteriaceae bacterium]
MLTAQKLGVAFGGEILFDDISFRIGPGDRIGLIGKNGAGKSTLLRLLAKTQTNYSGSLAFDKNCRIGYLPQDLDFKEGRTVVEEAYQAFTALLEIENRLETTNQALLERTDYESQAYTDLIIQQSELTSQYELLGGYTYQAATARILNGLGFDQSTFDRPTASFSGGWRMRIELAKLLLQDNDILLLDEPTNHLDIEAILWLEQFLTKYKGAVLLVSHDITFLNQVTNRTMELVSKQLFDFKKSYSDYLELRTVLREQQLAAKKNQDKQLAHTEKLIERFRAKATKASMAQSLIKKMDKIERIEVDPEETQTFSIHFPLSKQPGKVVVEAEGIGKAYGQNQVLKGVDLLIERGSKIAFVGQNGQGKTTLAKIIVNTLEHQGTLKLGHNVMLGYFAQNQAQQLTMTKTVLDTALDAAAPDKRPAVRDMLGAFLFQNDAVDKKVAVLSGGERNRLALCKLLLQPFNVLVMDEPTNHLDILAKRVLKEALLKFEGTLILVSHDRDFLDGLCDRVFEFRDTRVKEYLGGLQGYLDSKKINHLSELEALKPKANPKKNKGDTPPNQNKRKKAQNQLQKIETAIEQLENELKAIDLELEINYGETIAKPDFFDHYQAKKEKLERLFVEWEHTQKALDQLLEG